MDQSRGELSCCFHSGWNARDQQLIRRFQPEQLQDYGDLRESASLAMPSGFKCDYVVDFDGHSKLMLGSNT